MLQQPALHTVELDFLRALDALARPLREHAREQVLLGLGGMPGNAQRQRLEAGQLQVRSARFVGRRLLIVDSTNSTDLGDRFDENLHLVERFSRIGRDTLLYEFTIDDPTVYTMPWTVGMPMKRSTDRLFEDACHEGNHSLSNMLRAVRIQEAQTP